MALSPLPLQARSVLAVAAHPDDLEYGALGTLLRLRASGAAVRSVLLTAATPERKAWSREALDPLGPVHVYDWPECGLVASRESVADVERHLADVDLVLTTTRWDTHQDHRALEGIVLAAVRRRPVSILGYDIVSATDEFSAQLYVDVAEQFERKLAAIRLHTTYADREYMQPDTFRAWHHARCATIAGFPCVERFHVYRAWWP